MPNASCFARVVIGGPCPTRSRGRARTGLKVSLSARPEHELVTMVRAALLEEPALVAPAFGARARRSPGGLWITRSDIDEHGGGGAGADGRQLGQATPHVTTSSGPGQRRHHVDRPAVPDPLAGPNCRDQRNQPRLDQPRPPNAHPSPLLERWSSVVPSQESSRETTNQYLELRSLTRPGHGVGGGGLAGSR